MTTPTNLEPVNILQPTPTVVALVWSDGRETIFTAYELRCNCPCAECVDEVTGVRTLDVNKVPRDMAIHRVSRVGRYALQFHFGDGHDTGFFTYEYLLELAEKQK